MHALALLLGAALSGCGGNAQSNSAASGASGTSGVANGSAAAGAGANAGPAMSGGAPNAIALMRAVPEICRGALQVPCATDADSAECNYRTSRLLGNASEAGCLVQAAAAVNCVATTQNDCDAEGHVISPGCDAALQAVNDCILSKTDWDELGCGSFTEPGTGAQGPSCQVTCGGLSANCASDSAGFVCTCTSGFRVGQTFAADGCPEAKQLAHACNFESIL